MRYLMVVGLLAVLAVLVEAGARWVIARRYAHDGAWWRNAGRPMPGLWRRYWWEFIDPTCRKRSVR